MVLCVGVIEAKQLLLLHVWACVVLIYVPGELVMHNTLLTGF